MANFVYGIDLGTTYSSIAYVDETGIPVCIKDRLTNDTTIPSVVFFEEGGNVVVGDTAKKNAILDPENTISFVKQSMGIEGAQFNPPNFGKTQTPEEVSSYILKTIAASAKAMTGNEVKDVVITVPAYFGTAEAEATKLAGRMAGLNVMEILREPTAAAIYYGCTKKDSGDKNILIYDLGGGTFDVSVMRSENGQLVEIWKEGDHQLGGRNWDNEVQNHLWETYCKEADHTGERDSYANAELADHAEGLKKGLSSAETASAVVKIGKPKRITLTRATFDKLTANWLDLTIELTDRAVEGAKGKGCAIDKILLVGGSTKMPQVAAALRKKYNLEPEVLDPVEAVAKGAAIFALETYNRVQGMPGTPLDEAGKPIAKEKLDSGKLRFGDGGSVAMPVTSATKSYAVRMLVDDVPKCINLIFKDTPMPEGLVENSINGGTLRANQKEVLLQIYQSDIRTETYDPAEDFKIGELSLPLPGTDQAGYEVKCTLILGTDGILKVKGLDIGRNKEVQAVLDLKGGRTKEEETALINAVKRVSVSDNLADA